MADRVFDVLIPTIPHRHDRLCALLGHLDGQMQPGAGALICRDNLEHSIGAKNGALTRASRASYVAVLDDDDWVTGDYIATVLEAVAGQPDYVGWPVIYTAGGSGEHIIVHSLTDRRAQFPDACSFAGIAHKNPIRRELALLGAWDDGWGDDGGWAEDGRWAARVRDSGQVRTEAWVDHPVYHYRWDFFDEFRTPRQPLTGPLPALPSYPWLQEVTVA